MELKNFKDILFKKALSEGFEECEIYYYTGENLSINIYEGEVEKYNLDKSFGLSFRGKVNGKIGYSYTEILDDKAVDMLIKNVKDGVNTIENEDVQFIYEHLYFCYTQFFLNPSLFHIHEVLIQSYLLFWLYHNHLTF